MFWSPRFSPILGVAALAALVSAAYAGAGHESTVKIAVGTGDDVEMVTIDELPVGDSRHLFTDSGREVMIFRHEDHIELEVDGKSMVIGMPAGTKDAADAGREVRIEKRIEVHADSDHEVVVVEGGFDELKDIEALEGIDLEQLELLVDDSDGETVIDIDVNDDGVEEQVIIIKRSSDTP